MTRQAREVTKQAMALPREERIALAETLLTSADDFFATPEIEAAWLVEIERRVKEIETGQAKLIPADVVHRRVRAAVHEASRLSPRR